MKKFSKILCLVLVVVMMAGLCAVGTTAAYKDADKITYTEAVDVLSGIGVLQGDDNGFRPNDTLTRAEACKIIAYLTGAENVTTPTTFADCKGHWAASYIGYCAAMGYVNGVGGNKFNPDGILTGSAFAKMLLGALGYDATIEGMTGSTYEVAVARLVKTTQLAKGIAKFVGANNISREEAAQLALNALNATEVEYTKSQNQNSNGSTSITTWLTADPVPGPGGSLELREDYFENLVVTSANDAYGNPSNNYVYNGKEIGTYANPATYTYDSVMLQKVLRDSLGSVACDSYGWNVTIDGASVGTPSTPGNVMAPYSYTANGAITKIYVDNTNRNVDVVVTTYQIAKVDKITADQVTLKYGAFTAPTTWASSKNVTKTSNLYATLAAKTVGDYVAIAIDNNGDVYKVADVTKVTGTVSSYVAKTSTTTVGGTNYVVAGACAGANAPTTVGAVPVDMYLSAEGYVLGAYPVKAAASTYLYVLAKSTDGTAKDGYTYNVKVLTADGTIEWLPVTQYQTATATTVKSTDLAWNFASVSANTYYGYAQLADGTYKLVALNGATANYGALQTTEAGVTTAVTSATFGGQTATNTTAYLIPNANGTAYTAKTGYKAMTPGTGITGEVLYENGIAKMVVITTVGTASATKDSVLFLRPAHYTESFAADGVTALRTYDAIVNGEVTTIQVVASASPALNTVYAGNTYAEGGYITTLAAGITANTLTWSTGAELAANGTVGVAAATLQVKIVDGVLFLTDGTYTHTAVLADGFKAVAYNNITASAEQYKAGDLALSPIYSSEYDDTGDFLYVGFDKDGEVTTLIAVDCN